jgi:hypothetical protein
MLPDYIALILINDACFFVGHPQLGGGRRWRLPVGGPRASLKIVCGLFLLFFGTRPAPRGDPAPGPQMDRSRPWLGLSRSPDRRTAAPFGWPPDAKAGQFMRLIASTAVKFSANVWARVISSRARLSEE